MDTILKQRRAWLEEVQADYRNRRANRWAAIIVASLTVGYFIAHVVAYAIVG